MARQRRPERERGSPRGRNIGGGRERSAASSERGQRELTAQEREQRDLQRRGGPDIDRIDRAIREMRERSIRSRGERARGDSA